LAKELESINIFVIEKVGEIKSRAGEENILFNRNIASHLAVLPQILPP
jgi:hypothetical protein